MATNTYVALDKVTLGSNGGTVTFTNIPATYTDLVLEVSGGFVDNGFAFGIRVGNGSVDSGSNYSFTWIKGNGSVATSGRGSNFTLGVGIEQGINNLSNVAQINFMNYANTSVYKTWLTKGGSAGDNAGATANLWRSFSAINTISISESGTGGSGSFNYGNMLAGTTFSLYGIAAEGVSPAAKATGGAIYSDADYFYHVFAASGTFTPLQSLSADMLCVAGGGGGGTANRGGGGGAGGVIYFAGQSLTATGYTCTIGAGGAGFTQGVNTQFASLTVASGGGRGGASNFGGAYLATAGGSGGGNGNDGTNNGGASNQSSSGATAIYGNRGGNVTVGGDVAGGGGAGAAGTDGVNTNNGIAGGIGTNAFSSWLSATGLGHGGGYIAAGGNGASNYSGGGLLLATRPLGGGGANSPDSQVANGIASTGSGGSGFSYNSGSGTYPAGQGGSGIVIVRYAKV